MPTADQYEAEYRRRQAQPPPRRTPAPSPTAQQYQQEADRRSTQPMWSRDQRTQNYWTQQGYGSSGSGLPSYPTSFGGGGGGGGARYSGSGAGAPALDQSTADMMMRLLQRGPQPMQYQNLDLPDYQGTPMAAFDPSMYNQMRGNLQTAGARDRAAATDAYTNLANTLGSNYQNAYANARTTGTPQIQNAMQRMLGAGAGAVNNTIAQENAYSQNSDGAFGNLLALLAGNEDMSQRSRLNQVGMDQNTTLRGLDASLLGLGAGIDVSQGRAQQDHTNRSQERAYQDALMAQQWAREEAMQNWQGQNNAAQTNTQTQNQWSQGSLQGILDLIMQMQQSGLTVPQVA